MDGVHYSGLGYALRNGRVRKTHKSVETVHAGKYKKYEKLPKSEQYTTTIEGLREKEGKGGLVKIKKIIRFKPPYRYKQKRKG